MHGLPSSLDKIADAADPATLDALADQHEQLAAWYRRAAQAGRKPIKTRSREEWRRIYDAADQVSAYLGSMDYSRALDLASSMSGVSAEELDRLYRQYLRPHASRYRAARDKRIHELVREGLGDSAIARYVGTVGERQVSRIVNGRV